MKESVHGWVLMADLVGIGDRHWDAAGRAAWGVWRCAAAGTLHGEGALPPGRRREGGGAAPLGEGRPAAGRVPVAVGWPDRTANLFLSDVACSGAREWSEHGRAFVFRDPLPGRPSAASVRPSTAVFRFKISLSELY